MQAVQQGLELGFVLPVHQVFDQIGLGVAFFLAVDQIGDQLLATQAFLHFGQGVLGVFRVEAAGRRGQLVRGGGWRHALRLKVWVGAAAAGFVGGDVGQTASVTLTTSASSRWRSA